MVAWVAAVYHAHDAEQRVADGPAAYQVRFDDGHALLVRKRTGEYWSFTGDTDLHLARNDRRLRHALRKVVFDVDRPTGVVHNPSLDLTQQQLMAWLDDQGLFAGQIVDRGWAFLAIKGPVLYGGYTGRSPAMFAVVKRTGEVWDLMQGYHADTASNARTEPGFHAQLAMIAPGLQPIARIPR